MNLAIVIVSYDDGEALARGLDAVAEQLQPGDEVVVVHNGSDAPGGPRTAAVAAAHGACRLIDTGGNPGFSHAVNRGAAETTAPVLVLLNPDAVPEPGCLDALRAPPPEWSAWMGLVTLADGRTVNTAGNHGHYLGFGWIGRYGEPVEAIADEPHEVGLLSGACLAVRRETFEEVGRFPDLFFLYVEDTDFSHRLRLAGHRFGVTPRARVRHAYEFGGRPAKMRELEKNRWLMVVRCYPRTLLWAVMPAMIMLEPIMLVIAIRGGWGKAKLAAIRGVMRALPAAVRQRRAVQRRVRIPVSDFAAALRWELDSPLFGAVGRSWIVRALLWLYWRAVLVLLRARAPSRGG